VERERRKSFVGNRKWGREASFWLSLDPNFSTSGAWR
jgi:hypothetical protein